MTFEQAYRSHQRDVTRYLRRRCDGAIELDDALQETFLQAWRLWDRSEVVDNVRAWLISIARRVFSHMLRSLSAARRSAMVVPIFPEDKDGDNDEGVSQDRLPSIPAAQGVALYVEQLRAHFHGLGPAQRESLCLVSQGYSAGEIAEATGRTVAATNMALSLGRRRLREQLGVDAARWCA